METYLALFEPDRNAGGYVVTFPDFGNGVRQGETDDEAMEMAQDLLILTIGDYIRASKPCHQRSATGGRVSAPFLFPPLKRRRSTSTLPSWTRA